LVDDFAVWAVEPDGFAVWAGVLGDFEAWAGALGDFEAWAVAPDGSEVSVGFAVLWPVDWAGAALGGYHSAAWSVAWLVVQAGPVECLVALADEFRSWVDDIRVGPA
jgi:hypothetical protein